MCRFFVLFFTFMCFLHSIKTQAQQTISKSQIDSLSRLFHVEKDNKIKINIIVQSPKRIDEYFDKPMAILELHQKALTLAKNIDDAKSCIKLLLEMGYFEMYILRDESKAFSYYSQALVYAEAEKDYESCMIITYNLAAISEHQNFKSEMYAYFLKSIAFSQKSSVIYLKPYRWLSWAYLEEDRINDALRIGRQAINYVEERSATAEFKAIAYGLYFAALKKIPDRKQEAAVCKQKIITFLQSIKISTISDYFTDIAVVCYEVEQYNLAILFSNQLLKKKDRNSRRNVLRLVAYEIIANSSERLGDYRSSLDNYKKYSTIYVQELKIITSLESNRKIIQAEKERDLLIKQKEVEKEKFYRNIGVSFSVFIFILSAVILFIHRRERSQKRKLELLNTTKDKLFAILAHDLRSPIGILENSITLTNWGVFTQQEFNKHTHYLGQEIKQLSTMLDNLLQWAISQLRGIKPSFSSFSIAPVLHNQIELLLPNLHAKNIHLTHTIDPELTIFADVNHFTIIVRNILQNAVKFTQPGGQIDIQAFFEYDKIFIQFTDSGIGIPTNHLDSLFEINKEPSRLGTAQEKGTGLGLVLVKQLVDSNHAMIQVFSEPNQGTTFTICFPSHQ